MVECDTSMEDQYPLYTLEPINKVVLINSDKPRVATDPTNNMRTSQLMKKVEVTQ